MTAYFYDNVFVYAFFAKLRNYAQHCGVPISAVNFDLDYVGDKVRWSFTPQFYRDVLLKNYEKWGARVKPDLEAQPKRFEVLPLFGSYDSIISEVARNVEASAAGRFTEAAKFLSGYTFRIRKEG